MSGKKSKDARADKAASRLRRRIAELKEDLEAAQDEIRTVKRLAGQFISQAERYALRRRAWAIVWKRLAIDKSQQLEAALDLLERALGDDAHFWGDAQDFLRAFGRFD